MSSSGFEALAEARKSCPATDGRDQAPQLTLAYDHEAVAAAEAALRTVTSVQGVQLRGHRPFPHPFPARMPLEIARAAVRAFSEPGEVVLDPMCGSGVVLRAAQLERRQAIGSDVDPLAVLLAKALCLRDAPVEFLELAGAIEARARQLAGDRSFLNDRFNELTAEDQAFVRYWFPESHYQQLFALAAAIEATDPSTAALTAAICFSSCIISRASGASWAMDLSRSRPHKVATKAPREPFDLWKRAVANFVSHYP